MEQCFFSLTAFPVRINDLRKEGSAVANDAAWTFSEIAKAMKEGGFISLGEVFNLATQAKEVAPPLGKATFRACSAWALTTIIQNLPDLTKEDIVNLANGKWVTIPISWKDWDSFRQRADVDGTWSGRG